MTVAELIEKLKTMPPEAKVIHINYRWHKIMLIATPMCFLIRREVAASAQE